MTDKETIEWQRIKIKQLQYRLKTARSDRDTAWSDRDKALDVIDKQQREAVSRGMLEGPAYRSPFYCSDGRVWAAKATTAREETIRWFAGQVLGEAMGHAPDLDTAFRGAVNAGFRLWEYLEARFEAERAERKAAEEKADAEQDGDGDESKRDGD